jgi:predicted DNA-binding protein (UPF0251 family)
MSTALQFHSFDHATQPATTVWRAPEGAQRKPIATAVSLIYSRPTPEEIEPAESNAPAPTWAFYRKHTESMLRRYLYASMQVGRSPSLLADSIGKGWVSSRKVRTFEDAVIFVLDIEQCIHKLSLIDRQMISRVVLQEYTHSEAASLLGLSTRTLCAKLPEAMDRLTELLVKADLLTLPE